MLTIVECTDVVELVCCVLFHKCNFVPACAQTLRGDHGLFVKSWSASVLTEPFPVSVFHTAMVRWSLSGL